jgi:hypothetical protein
MTTETTTETAPAAEQAGVSPPTYARFGWLVTADRSGMDAVLGPEFDRTGVHGPHDIAPDILARLRAGEGVPWRTLYDTDNGTRVSTLDPEGETIRELVVHEGVLIDLDLPEGSDSFGDPQWGPLDYSRDDCGAAFVQFQVDGRWVLL